MSRSGHVPLAEDETPPGSEQRLLLNFAVATTAPSFVIDMSPEAEVASA
jgi:hypothetical protein